MIIYKITFPNGKGYVGKTKHEDPKVRFKDHCVAGTLVGNAIRKYGRENVKLEILHSNIETYEDLNDLERQYIEQHQTHKSKNGYNVSLGGDAGNIFAGRSESESNEIRIKMSTSRKKFLDSIDEYTRKQLYSNSGIKNGMFGKKHSEDSILKIREARRRQVLSPESQKQGGLSRSGEKHYSTKYSKEDWQNIYSELKSGFKLKEIAKKYNVSQRTIENLSTGKHWSQRHE